uniref:Uncharacterized protein n=1 Tax=Avena sativa TaxID=4498 RepID=A0ACD5YAM4_AVESA
MLPHSIRHFISADTHSWVYVKKYTSNVKKDETVMKMCPLHFNMHGKYVHDNGDLGSHENDTWRNTSIPLENGNSFQKATDNGHLLSADVNSISESMSEQKVLIKQWLIGQLKEMRFHAECSEISSVVLPAKVLIHFEVVDGKQSRGGDFIYLLTIAFENSGYNNSQGNIEITWNAPTDDPENLELNFGRLELGEAISIDSVLENGFNDAFKLTRSSLGWMDNAMTDVTKRLSVLLSSGALRLFNRLKFPFPGHVLVHGPRGSGKTALTRAAAKYFEDHKEILAHVIYMDCSKLAIGKAKETRQTIEDSISKALLHSPSVINLMI